MKKKIPQFKSDKEEARFWSKHSLSDYWDDLEEAKGIQFVRPQKQVVTIRIERDLVQRLKAIAQKKGTTYSSLIRMWVIERLNRYKEISST
jgi:predicted DNA binding CopG/RHH family protein